MVLLHLLPHISSFDVTIALLSFSAGLLYRFRGITILIQVSLLLIKMAKHFYDTHPEGAKLKPFDPKMDRLYTNQLSKYDPSLLETKQTGAQG